MGRLAGVKARIFVVEDNPGDVTLLKMALEDAEVDCELTVMGDGGEALAYVSSWGPEIAGLRPILCYSI